MKTVCCNISLSFNISSFISLSLVCYCHVCFSCLNFVSFVNFCEFREFLCVNFRRNRSVKKSPWAKNQSRAKRGQDSPGTWRRTTEMQFQRRPHRSTPYESFVSSVHTCLSLLSERIWSFAESGASAKVYLRWAGPLSRQHGTGHQESCTQTQDARRASAGVTEHRIAGWRRIWVCLRELLKQEDGAF